MARKKKEGFFSRVKRRAKEEIEMLKNEPKGYGGDKERMTGSSKGSDRGKYMKKKRSK